MGFNGIKHAMYYQMVNVIHRVLDVWDFRGILRDHMVKEPSISFKFEISGVLISFRYVRVPKNKLSLDHKTEVL